jgi:hypothetical protein
MAKLQVDRDNGTVTFPLRGRDPVTLDEPGMLDLAWLSEETSKIDDTMPDLPTVTDRNDPVQIAAWQEATDKRRRMIYGDDQPYGKLVVETIKRFSDGAETVEPNQLYGWAASPTVIRTILELWRTPLAGPESPPSL